MARDAPDENHGGCGVEESRGGFDLRFGILPEFSLTLHPDKTRLIEFGGFAAVRRARRGSGKSETFTFI